MLCCHLRAPIVGCFGGLLIAGAAWNASAESLPRFPATSVWNQDISRASLRENSDHIISALSGLGGFGNGRMQIDFSLLVVHAPVGAPTRSIVGYPFGDYWRPDCEAVGTPMPVPVNASIEGQPGLTCDNAADDCHLLVVQGPTLYEAYHANASGATDMQAQCLAIWHLSAVYPAQGRGDHCTSGDAAGFPIAPLLINADEVFAATQVTDGDLGHALRFILPNERMARDGSLGGVGGRLYVRPATHAGQPTGPVDTVPYGSRLRLRPDFPFTGYNAAAQVVLRTMMRYGIVLADGGNIALTAESDRYTTHTWDELGLRARTFDQTSGASTVTIDDFSVLDTGRLIPETFDCVRTVVEADTLFADGFQ